jgi:hypothetical protein
MPEEAAEKVESVTSAAKADRWRQRSYRSAEALRHPKADFFRSL